MIEGVILKQLQTHSDERGFFREVIRDSDEFFDSFAQLSYSMIYTGVVKAWHYHKRQTDWWYVPIGMVKAVLCDIRNTDIFIERGDEAFTDDKDRPFHPVARLSYDKGETLEFLLGEYHQQVLKISPGIAHGLKVLQGPAHLFYITSNEYDSTDEGRIPQDALGYNWFG